MNTKTPKSTQTTKKIVYAKWFHKSLKKKPKKLVSVLFKTGKSSLHFFSLMTTPISGDQLCPLCICSLGRWSEKWRGFNQQAERAVFQHHGQGCCTGRFLYKHVQRSYPVADRIVSSGPPPRSLLGTSPSSLSPCLPRILLPQCWALEERQERRVLPVSSARSHDPVLLWSPNSEKEEGRWGI